MRNHSDLNYKIAIVGASRLTENEERDAQQFCGLSMNEWKLQYGDDLIIISGGADGIDTIAEKCAKQLDIKTWIFKADTQHWEDDGNLRGFKSRNIRIAEMCDELWCLPAIYRDQKCYHCNNHDEFPHQKSGGCWTAKRARENGKEVHIIPPTIR